MEDYFKHDELAYDVWKDKYRQEGESLEQFFERLEKGFDRSFSYDRNLSEYGKKRLNNPYRETLHTLFKDFKYIIPGGSVLYGIGTDKPVSLSNCYVLSTEDSISEIFDTAKYMANIYKRRGGCIEENTSIIVKDKGVLPIKDVEVGDYVLSFNTISRQDEWKRVRDKYYTDVDIHDQIELVYSNGTRLKTSKKHPVLTLQSDGYKFFNENSGKLTDSSNKSPNLKGFIYTPKELDKIGWFIGCHMGDGSSDNLHGYRIRIVGDSKDIIDEYKHCVDEILELDSSEVIISKNRAYKSEVWSYEWVHPYNKIIIEEYFDNQSGNKTHIWKIPSFIKEHDLWVPFLAGLIDSDGYITDSGRIDISICSRNAIDEIGKYLSSIGQPFTTSIKIPKRENESTVYNLHIHTDAPIYDYIINYIKHPKKLEKMTLKSESHHSVRIELTQDEIDLIVNFKYNSILSSTSKEYNNLKTISYNIKKSGKTGKAHLKNLLQYNIISEDLYNEIMSRTKIYEIIEDNKEKLTYIDIEVEENNNYYAGEFGFVNIHNCGTDMSILRPKGASVNNAAKTTTGIIPFMDLFSNVTNTIGQSGRRKTDETFFNIENIQSKYYGRTIFNGMLRERTKY